MFEATQRDPEGGDPIRQGTFAAALRLDGGINDPSAISSPTRAGGRWTQLASSLARDGFTNGTKVPPRDPQLHDPGGGPRKGTGPRRAGSRFHGRTSGRGKYPQKAPGSAHCRWPRRSDHQRKQFFIPGHPLVTDHTRRHEGHTVFSACAQGGQGRRQTRFHAFFLRHAGGGVTSKRK